MKLTELQIKLGEITRKMWNALPEIQRAKPGFQNDFLPTKRFPYPEWANVYGGINLSRWGRRGGGGGGGKKKKIEK
jgi:hypothetical protein